MPQYLHYFSETRSVRPYPPPECKLLLFLHSDWSMQLMTPTHCSWHFESANTSVQKMAEQLRRKKNPISKDAGSKMTLPKHTTYTQYKQKFLKVQQTEVHLILTSTYCRMYHRWINHSSFQCSKLHFTTFINNHLAEPMLLLSVFCYMFVDTTFIVFTQSYCPDHKFCSPN